MTVIARMSADQQAVILDIYRQGIASGMATFETDVPDWNEFDSKYLPHSRLMILEDGIVAGWAALSPVSPRTCYSGVAEVSVYVADSHQRKGIGRMLLQALIKDSEQNGIWSLLSVIHEENKASVHLHEQCGFRYIGYREKIAQLNGVWLTTVMMERRSKVTGM